MSGIYQSLLSNLWLTLLLVVVALGTLFVIWSRYTHSLWGKDFWVWLPVFGKMAKWSKMTTGIDNPDTERSHAAGATHADSALTTPAERSLFQYYADGLKVASPRQFNNYREFLILSDQNGRKPMVFFLWVVLALLTVAEAIGTGLLIAPILSQDITPNMAVVVGSVIALAIAAIALMITHGAGEDLFRNGLLTQVRKTYDEQSGFFDRNGVRLKNLDRVPPENDQSIDAQNSSIARLAARIGATTKPSMANRYLRMVFAVVFIVVFGLGTTFYRHYMFNQEQDAAHSGLNSAATAAPNYQSMFSGGGSGNAASGNLPLPDAVSSAAQQSQQQAQNAIQGDARKANDAGIIILTLIYVFTQVIGILTGYKYSFFNGDAEKAYHGTHGEMSYADYRSNVLDPVAQRAESRMEQLRANLARANPRFRDHAKRFSFIQAVTERIEEQPPTAPSSAPIAAVTSTVAPVTQDPPPLAVMPAAPTVTGTAAPLDFHALATHILAQDKAAQRAAMEAVFAQYGMTPEQKRQLADAIKSIKAQRPPANDPSLFDVLAD